MIPEPLPIPGHKSNCLGPNRLSKRQVSKCASGFSGHVFKAGVELRHVRCRLLTLCCCLQPAVSVFATPQLGFVPLNIT